MSKNKKNTIFISLNQNGPSRAVQGEFKVKGKEIRRQATFNGSASSVT
jgi:hypothetical protein